MSVYRTISNTSLCAGVLVYEGLNFSGQINISESLKYDLTPFNIVSDYNTTLAWEVSWTMASRHYILDYERVEKLAGYPDRYRLGQVSLMFGSFCYPPFFIDRENFNYPGRHPSWVVTGEVPIIDFYDTAPTELDTVDNIISFMNTSYGVPFGYGAQDPATQFAWDVTSGTEFTVNINYYAHRLDFATDPDPAPSIFWQWV